MPNDEFYIGYLPKAPAGIARFRRGIVFILLISAPVIAAVIASDQRTLPEGLFEFGVERTFEGVLLDGPNSILQTKNVQGESTGYLLVSPGKFGFIPDPLVIGGSVQVRGTLIQKDGLHMIEVHGPVEKMAGSQLAQHDSVQDSEFTEISLRGELVDTKCYLGVMRPATGKVHRACAVRCLSGGIPPGLLVWNADGGSTVYLLENSRGGPLEFDVEWAALSVTVAGASIVRGGIPVIRVNSMERIDE